ncbi:MAG: carboxypeptidase-like regulatory domain-containing protein [Bacteroidales bacterium]|nr:carboxypeptidase-like regulatory domain-containing protein [Bacteroidales bacterium]
MTDLKNASIKINWGKTYSFLTFILVLFSHFTVYSQSSDFIYGRLIDTDSGEGIPFATIMVKDLGKGVISNAQGDFIIPKTIQNQNDTLIISCMGYTSKYVNLKNLKKQELNTIALKVAVILLDEVVIKAKKRVKSLSPSEIVKKSIEQIPKNYSRSPFSYVAYYRDYQTKSDNYINLNEALIEVFDNGFNTCDRTDSKVRLLKYKVNQEFERDSTLEINYDNYNRKFLPYARIDPSGGNELTMLMIHDAIRNYEQPAYSFMYKMKDDFLINHKFTLAKIIEMEGGSFYVIDFKLSNPQYDDNYQVFGQMFINRDTYAIYKLFYSLYNTQNNEKQLIFNAQVEYVKHDNLMYLNYISFSNVFKMPNPKDFVITDILYNSKKNMLLVTFNNPYLSDVALKLSNYKVKIDNKRVDVKMVINDTRKTICLKLDDVSAFPKITNNDSNRIKIEIKNLTDIEGRILGVRTYLNYKQYRELFVQQVQTSWKEKPMSIIDKFLPLRDNNIPEFAETLEYWMNTPLMK